MTLVYNESKKQWVQSGAVPDLVDNSGGAAPDGTVQAIGAVFSQAEIANNFREVTAKINAILAALRDADTISS